ncbi:hypothetical protein NAE50_001861 [Salmonella enterica]|nr:hypothetical protein [Salmonella enterica]ELX2844171.1 hypothetical protein [Salmonella enterica]
MGHEPEWQAKSEPAQPNKSGLDFIKNLTSEEIQKVRAVAERIAASIGFYIKKG